MRLMIVDDELHVLNRLSAKIDWTSLGVDDLILCDDGDRALNEIKCLPADILLTDIKMVRVDGITLSRKALQINPALKIILMSAYDDKDYLKSAIDLHVIDYLEKPFSLDSAKKAVRKAVAEITAVQTTETGGSVQSILWLSQLALSLCRRPDDPKLLSAQVHERLPELAGCRFYCTYLVKYTPQSIDADGQMNAVNDLHVYQLFDGTHAAGVVTLVKKGMMVCHAGYDQQEVREAMAGVLKDKVAGLYPDCTVVVAAGRSVPSCDQLYQSYSEADMAIELYFFNEQPVQFYVEHTESICQLDQKALVQFKHYLQGRDRVAGRALLEGLYRCILEHEATRVRDIKNFYFQLIQIIVSETDELKLTEADRSRHYIWEIIYQLDTLRKLHEYTMELLDEDLANCQNRNSRMEVIEKVRSFIHTHAADPDLSLQAISKAHFMSVPYLCTCFKELTGTTIKAYLTEHRMAQARDLLRHTDLKIAEVANRTGYSDQNYFTKRFVKHYGVTPSKFKEQGL